MLKAILFDLGDTLFDTMPMRLWDVFHEGGLAAYARLQSLGCKLPSYQRYYSMNKRAVQLSFVRSRLFGGEVNCETLIRKNDRKLKLNLTEPQLRELAWLWYAPLVSRSRVAPEVIPTLTKLRDRGLKLAIVSNTFVPGFVLDRHLEMEHLLEFFPHRIYSSELGRRKPDRRVFEHTLRMVGVRADEAIFVGDNVHNDILGSKRAGILAILKQPGAETRTHHLADHLIRNIAELYQILPLLGAPADHELPDLPDEEDLAYEM